jgi:prevent-host-death family protein
MHTVGLKILKNRLSEYVRLAAAGETVVITDRNRVVAEIVPPKREPEGLTRNSVLARGVREGWITPARIRDRSPPPRKPIKGLSLKQLLAELEQDREDR